MPNIASVLKAEIARIARKEIRGSTNALKRAVVTYRAEIAALKRRTHGLEQELRRLGRDGAKASSQKQTTESSSEHLRFSAKGVCSAAASAWALRGSLRALVWRVGAVGVSLGVGPSPPQSQAHARHRRDAKTWEETGRGRRGFAGECLTA